MSDDLMKKLGLGGNGSVSTSAQPNLQAPIEVNIDSRDYEGADLAVDGSGAAARKRDDRDAAAVTPGNEGRITTVKCDVLRR